MKFKEFIKRTWHVHLIGTLIVAAFAGLLLCGYLVVGEMLYGEDRLRAELVGFDRKYGRHTELGKMYINGTILEKKTGCPPELGGQTEECWTQILWNEDKEKGDYRVGMRHPDEGYWVYSYYTNPSKLAF